MGLTTEHQLAIQAVKDSFPDPMDRPFIQIQEQFTSGDCYVFAKTLQLVLPEAKLRLDKTEHHVAVELDGIIFDAMRRKRSYYGKPFRHPEDDEYCLNLYGFSMDYPQDSICKIEHWIETYIQKQLPPDARHIQKRLQDYLTMCNTLNLSCDSETEYLP